MRFRIGGGGGSPVPGQEAAGSFSSSLLAPSLAGTFEEGRPDGQQVSGTSPAAVSLHYMRIVRAMFLDAPVGEVSVRPHRSYQILLGAFSVALLLFGVWWTPIVDWSQASLTFLRG